MNCEPKRSIGLTGATALVIGNIIGSGAFMLPAALAIFGGASLLGWIFTSFGAIFLALVFSKLATHISKTGGPHTFIQEAFGLHAGFIFAWTYWMISWIGNAAVVVAFTSSLSAVFNESIDPLLGLIIGLSILIFSTVINLKGLKEAAFIQILLTLLKLLPLVVIPIVGLFFINWDHFMPFNPTGKNLFSVVGTTGLLTLWSFVGIESATVPAGDVINPKKTIPIATIIGTLIVAFVYILGSFSIIGIVPIEILATSKAPYADAAAQIFGGEFWPKFIALSAAFCCFGTLNGWMLIVGQIPYGAAKDDIFPKFFLKRSENCVPTNGIIISSTCIGLVLFLTLNENLITQFTFIINLAGTTILLVYIGCMLAYFKFLIQQKAKNIVEYFIGFIALSFSLWLYLSSDWIIIIFSLILMLLGYPFFIYSRIKKSQDNSTINSINTL